MKKEIIPYTVSDLHSTIDYMKLMKLQDMAFSETLVEQSKQKTYYQPTRNPYTQSDQRKRVESQSQSKFQ